MKYYKTDIIVAILVAAAAGLAIPSLSAGPDRQATYQIEAEQGGYADEYFFGGQGCPEADDPSETVLAVSANELVREGCTTIFEL